MTLRSSSLAAFLVAGALSPTAQASPTKLWQLKLPPPSDMFIVSSIVRDDCADAHHARVNRIWLERRRVGEKTWERFVVAGQTNSVTAVRDGSVTISTRELATPTRALQVLVDGPGPTLVQRYYLRAASETIVVCGQVAKRLPPRFKRIRDFDVVHPAPEAQGML